MAAFSTMTSAETRCKSQVVAKTWLVAHAARSTAGAIVARFIRPMSATNPDYGAWTETAQDNAN